MGGDQKLIFLCISEELGLLMDWVIYFVYHYVDLLDHWKNELMTLLLFPLGSH